MRRLHLSLERQVTERDKVLGIPPQWEEVAVVLATVEHERGLEQAHERVQGDAVDKVGWMKIRFRWSPTVDTMSVRDRFRNGTKLYHIESISNIGERNSMVECVCGETAARASE